MAMYDEMPPAVRQGTSWKPSALLVFAMLILTVLTIQLGGKIRSQRNIAPPEPTTVMVGQFPQAISPQGMASNASNFSNQIPNAYYAVQSIRVQVTSPELIRQALNDLYRSDERFAFLSKVTDDTVKTIQQDMQVGVGESPLGEKCLKLQLPWQNTQLAAKFLKFLGTRYADQYRTAWTNETARECQALKSAVARTGQAYDEAVAQLEFCQQYIDFINYWQGEASAEPRSEIQQPLLTTTARQEPHPPENAVALEKAASPLRAESDVENPEWIELHNNLVETRKKEAKLLITRTSMHPEVKFVQDQIREYEAQIAMTSRWIHKETNSPRPLGDGPGVRAEEPVVSNKMANTNNTAKNPPTIPNNFSKFEAYEQLLAHLEKEVDRTAEAYREAVAREQTVLGQQSIAPEISVRAWEPRKIAVIVKKPSPDSFGWLAGLAMAFGMSLICTGAAIESPIGSAEELHRLTAVPIVGVVPSYNPAVDPQIVKRTKNLLRFGLFLSGLITMSACVWVIVRLV